MALAQRQAFRTLKRGADGTQKVIFLDAVTGQELTDLTGYSVVEAQGTTGGLDPSTLNPSVADPSGKVETPEVADTSQQVADQIIQEALKTNGSESAVYGIINNYERTAANNYGYLDKPGWAKIANALPGFLGLGGKVVNAMVNHSNVVAADKARSALGLPTVGAKETTKGVFGQSEYANGLVANVNINGKTYAVGFEAQLADGRTTLTPEEARVRGLTTGTKIEEASEEQVAQAVAANNQQFPEQKGFIGRAVDGLRNGVVDAGRAVLGLEPKDRTPKGPGLAGMVDKSMAGYTPAAYAGQQTADSVRKSATAALASIGGQKASDFDYTPTTPQYNNEPNYGYNYAKDPNAINAGIRGVASRVASEVQHPVNVSSGYRSPAYNASIGGAKQSAHTSGNAIDISTRGLSDTEKRDLVNRVTRQGRQEFGPGGFRIGTYKDQSLHIDNMKHSTPDYGGVHAMYDRTASLMSNAPSWYKEGLFDSTVPVPTILDRAQSPVETAPVGLVQQGRALDPLSNPNAPAQPPADPNKMKATASALTSYNERKGQMNPTLEGFMGVDMTKASPAQLAQAGWGTPNQPTMDQMARTIAGELGPRSLANINSPEVQTEIANIATTMANRQYSTKYDGNMTGVLSGDQYNANFMSNAQTTDANYAKYGGAIKDSLAGFYSGQVAPTNADYTHYHADYMSPPDWAQKANPAYHTGQHNFYSGVMTADGQRPDYRYSSDFERERQGFVMGPYASRQMDYQTSVYGDRGLRPSFERASYNAPTFSRERDRYVSDSINEATRGTRTEGLSTPSFGRSSSSSVSSASRNSSSSASKSSKNNSYDFGGLAGGYDKTKPASGNSASKSSKGSSSTSNKNTSSKSAASKDSSKSNVGSQNTKGVSNKGSIGGGMTSSKPASGNNASKSSGKTGGVAGNSNSKSSSKSSGGASNSKSSSGKSESSSSASKGKK